MSLSKKISYTCVALSAMLTLTACHQKVQPVSKLDEKLTCAQLCSEIKTTEDIKANIEKKRGFSGRNVGLGLLFWPGVVINEVTGESAESDANARLTALRNIYADKQCPADKLQDVATVSKKKESKNS